MNLSKGLEAVKVMKERKCENSYYHALSACLSDHFNLKGMGVILEILRQLSHTRAHTQSNFKASLIFIKHLKD